MSTILPNPHLSATRRALLALVPFLLIVYLGFEGGGFDPILYGRVGIGIWWIVLLSAAIGAVGWDRQSRRGLIVVGLLAGLAAWTGLSMIWSESADRSAQELARASTYAAAFLGILLLRSVLSLRLLLGAVTAALATIAVAAVCARLQPSLFPDNETVELVGAAVARLNYPLNSWNGLAGLIAIAFPLLVFFAAHARHIASRSLACAALPLLALGLFWTLSRGGTLALAAGLVAMVALHPARRRLLAPLGAGLIGGGVLIRAADARTALTDGLDTPTALSQGDEMTAIVVGVAVAAALVPFFVDAVAWRLPLPRLPLLSREAWMAIAAGAVAALVVAAVAIDLPGEVDQRWEEFKDPGVAAGSERLESASGNGRYQWWDAALAANASDPILGIGAGTFEFWWSREGSIASQVVDAHSLYLEALGELGIVGLLLIVAVVGGALVAIAAGAISAREPSRAALAAIAGGAVAFAVAAGTDWAWELPILPIAFLLLAGIGIGARGAPKPSGGRSRIGLALLATVGALVIVPPLLGADAVRESQEKVVAGDLGGALDAARRSAEFEPYSGPAELQKALVLELKGKLTLAAVAAQEATRKEPTNWANWLTLSRIEVERGESEPAIAAYERARELNPNSALFDEDFGQPPEQ